MEDNMIITEGSLQAVAQNTTFSFSLEGWPAAATAIAITAAVTICFCGYMKYSR